MNNKALTLSIVMAVFAVMMVQSYVGGIEEEAKKRFGTEIHVVKAKRDIKEMETINETMVSIELVPKKFLEPAAISFDKKPEEKDYAKSLSPLVGKIAMVPVKKGEQITFNKINDPGIRTGLSPQITPGKRAVAIPVGEASSVSKLVKPGDRIDVIAILDAGGGKTAKIAKTILQDTAVLSVGRSVTNNAPRTIEADSFTGKDKVRSLAEDYTFNTVTVEVDPMQAQMIALLLAQGESSLSISLRNNDDGERYNLGSTGFGDLLGADVARFQRGVAGKQ